MSEWADASRWAADAEEYDAWFGRPWGAYASAVEHRLLLAAVPALAGRRVCDAGCGTGRFTAELQARGARVVGIDRDRAAIAVARRRVAGPLLEGDVQRLPFADAVFDATFAVTVCEFTSSPSATIAELVRITRPGGHVVIGSLNRHSPWAWSNHRRFSRPPWNAATFLTRTALARIAQPYGTTTWHAGLFAPRRLPRIDRWGPTLERIGRRLLPRAAAFGVLAISLPDLPNAACDRD